MMNSNDKEYQNVVLVVEDDVTDSVPTVDQDDPNNIINNNHDLNSYDGKRQKVDSLSSSSSSSTSSSYLKPPKEYSINRDEINQSNNNKNDGNNNENENSVDNNNIDDDDGPTSSFENIIPPHLQSTFSSIGLFMSQTLETVQAKAVELNNSEAVKNMKLKTADVANKTYETSVKSWEQTKEVTTPYFNAAIPYYEKSVDTVLNGVTYIADKTVDNVPTLNEVERTISNTWKSLSSAAAQIVGDSENTSSTTAGSTDTSSSAGVSDNAGDSNSMNGTDAAAPATNGSRSSSSSSTSSAFII